MTQKPSDDPVAIARYLIREHGLEGALHAAIQGRDATQDAQHYYELSIWREVVTLLRQEIRAQAA